MIRGLMRFAVPCYGLTIALLASTTLIGAQAGTRVAGGTLAGDVCHAPTTPSPFTSAERVLVNLECQAIRATNARDAGALQALMADDYSLTISGGRTIRHARNAMIARWTDAPPPGERGVTRLLSVERVHVHATSGFVTGTIEDRSIVGSRQTCVLHAFTDWWERRHGDWVWVHSHESGARTAACAGR